MRKFDPCSILIALLFASSSAPAAAQSVLTQDSGAGQDAPPSIVGADAPPQAPAITTVAPDSAAPAQASSTDQPYEVAPAAFAPHVVSDQDGSSDRPSALSVGGSESDGNRRPQVQPQSEREQEEDESPDRPSALTGTTAQQPSAQQPIPPMVRPSALTPEPMRSAATSQVARPIARPLTLAPAPAIKAPTFVAKIPVSEKKAAPAVTDVPVAPILVPAERFSKIHLSTPRFSVAAYRPRLKPVAVTVQLAELSPIDVGAVKLPKFSTPHANLDLRFLDSRLAHTPVRVGHPELTILDVSPSTVSVPTPAAHVVLHAPAIAVWADTRVALERVQRPELIQLAPAYAPNAARVVAAKPLPPVAKPLSVIAATVIAVAAKPLPAVPRASPVAATVKPVATISLPVVVKAPSAAATEVKAVTAKPLPVVAQAAPVVTHSDANGSVTTTTTSSTKTTTTTTTTTTTSTTTTTVKTEPQSGGDHRDQRAQPRDESGSAQLAHLRNRLAEVKAQLKDLQAHVSTEDARAGSFDEKMASQDLTIKSLERQIRAQLVSHPGAGNP